MTIGKNPPSQPNKEQQMKAKPKIPATLPIHEYDQQGRHRIVVQNPDGTCEASPWVPTTETAVMGKLYAASTDTPLPFGLFIVKNVPHRVLA
jgi:hypothetical protein